ncbi:hypothetical protein NN6n1_42830 [Shinella zoogloeoides]
MADCRITGVRQTQKRPASSEGSRQTTDKIQKPAIVVLGLDPDTYNPLKKLDNQLTAEDDGSGRK